MAPPLAALRIEDLRRAAESPELEDRGRAMQALLIRIRRDPSLKAAALPIFRRVCAREPHGWPATLAARGIEDIEGDIAARSVWTELLQRESPQMVSDAAGSLTDPWYVPMLLDLLQRRSEPEVRAAVIRALGRMKNQAVFPAVIGFLDDPALRLAVIEALASQGDVRARPYLEPLVDDQTETGEWDERGAPVRVGSLAWNALRRIDEPELAALYRHLPFNELAWGDPVPPMLGGPPPFRFEAAADAPPVAPSPATPTRAAQAPAVAVPSAPPRSRFAGPPWSFALPATVNGFRLVAAVPMMFAVASFAWAFALLVGLLEASRVGEKTILQTDALGPLGMIPGVLGVLAALVIPLLYRLKALEFLVLVVGALACLPMTLLFGREWFLAI
jgi:hypothetical protein